MHPHFDRFLRVVHRRLVLLRALERSGACAAVAAAFALVAAGVLAWRGEDALPWAAATLALGAILGFAWGLFRRPRLLDAAVEADRQLDLSDLLATALACRAGADEWSTTVAALAEARCRTLAPRAVVLHRYGSRAWGGIALSSALVLTLGIASNLTMDTSRARAHPQASLASPSREVDSASSDPDPAGGASPSLSRSSPPRAPDSTAQRAQRTGSERTFTPSAHDTRRDGSPASPGESPGAGSASGETDARSTSLPQPPPAPTAPTARQATPAGETAAGGGAAAVAATDSTATSPAGSRAGGNDDSESSPLRPWQRQTWSDDRAAALRAVRSGRVPDATRDVIREYFRNPEGQ